MLNIASGVMFLFWFFHDEPYYAIASALFAIAGAMVG